jgi:hypothetical protein
MPTKAGHESPHRIRDHIKRVSDGMRHELWTDILKQHGPKHQVECYFGYSWKGVISAQSQPPMQPKDRRQGAGNQPEVIKISVKEEARCMWFQRPSIERVSHAADKKKRIATIQKPSHIKAALK